MPTGSNTNNLVIGYECEQHDNPADFVLEVVLLNEAQEAKRKWLCTYCVFLKAKTIATWEEHL